MDLTEASGCFVQLADGKLTLTGDDTNPAKVYGCLIDVAEAEQPCDIALPGFAGIVDVRVSAGSSGVTDGSALSLAANGTVDTAAAGKVVVAVALSDAGAGDLVDARLVQPYQADAATVALTAVAGNAIASTSTTKKTTTK